MKISDMNMQEMELFDYQCKKFETQLSSTEEFKALLKQLQIVINENEKQMVLEFEAKRKYLSEVERIMSNLEKGIFRK